MTVAFLYKWTNVLTNKWYVGSRTRKNCHPNDGYICSSKIVKPMIIENLNNWSREILCIGSPLFIRNLEADYLIHINAKNDEMSYNLHNGDGKFSFAGATHSVDTRNKLSIATKNMSDERRQKLANARIGKKCSDETRIKMSLARLGKKRPKVTEETRKKLSNALKGKKVVHSYETRKKISESNKGRIVSDETRKKLSETMKRKGSIGCLATDKLQ